MVEITWRTRNDQIKVVESRSFVVVSKALAKLKIDLSRQQRKKGPTHSG